MHSSPRNRHAALPNEGQPVEFVLEGRTVAMDGTYEAQTFRSRWSNYAVDRVCSWRSADATADERGIGCADGSSSHVP